MDNEKHAAQRPMTPDEAAARIRALAADYKAPQECYFPAIEQAFTLDPGKVAIDLGVQEDYISFLSELDKLLLGVSRYNLAGRKTPSNLAAGLSDYYAFHAVDKPPVQVHWWICSTKDQMLEWHIRGHEEGHVIDKTIADNVRVLKERMNMVTGRQTEEALPTCTSSVAMLLRGSTHSEALRKSFDFTTVAEDAWRYHDFFGVHPESKEEARVIHSAVYCQGVHTRRRRDQLPIGEHVRQMIEYIDTKNYEPGLRSRLRVAALMHDLGKYVTNAAGKTMATKRKHGDVSWDMAKELTADEDVLYLVRYHDYPFYLYKEFGDGKLTKSDVRHSPYARAIAGTNLDILLEFNYADSCHRNLAPVDWFKKNMRALR